MSEAVQIIAKAASDGKIPLLRNIVLRSAHANGLGWSRIACPPIDYRHPPNAFMATLISQEIMEGFVNTSTRANGNKKSPFVSFVDTNPVLDPVWDCAKDWSHYRDQQEWVETIYLLTEILKQDL